MSGRWKDYGDEMLARAGVDVHRDDCACASCTWTRCAQERALADLDEAILKAASR